MSTVAVPLHKRTDTPQHAAETPGQSEIRTFPVGQRDKDPAQLRSFWREVRLRPGLWVSALDAAPCRDVCVQYEKDNALFDFGFFLNGAVFHRIRNRGKDMAVMNNRAGTGGLGCLPGVCGTIRLPSRLRTCVVHVHVSPDFLRALLGDDLALETRDLQDMLLRGRQTDLLFRGRMDPAVHTAASELFNSVTQNRVSRLYVEAKALELMALQLAWTRGKSTAPVQGAPLSPRERRVVGQARDLLVENLAAPPTLAEMSSTLGLSISKLQAGFRERYDMSVFSFLREYKLQQAKRLLGQADMNVSEVAWKIGYTNLSHFSAAYRKRFGVLPKNYLRSAKSNQAPDRTNAAS